MKLVIIVDKTGIHFRYPPFIRKTRYIGKEEIESFELRKYKPILEYGGWGMKRSVGKSGRAYNVRGKTGLQLYLKNGQKVLFGTQNGNSFLRAMNKLMKGE